MTKRVYGWRPSLPDHRDLRFDHQALWDGSPLPTTIDPRNDPLMPIIWDQGNLGSCTSNAVAACLQYNLGRIGGKRARRPSRLDIYYGERALEGQPADQDTGAYGRDGFKFAQQTGYLLETAWPYDISTFAGPPPPGGRVKLSQQYALVSQTQLAIQTALVAGQFVAFGFTVYDSFESPEVAATGIVPYPSMSEGVLGGHEIVMVGYLANQPGYVLCRNSWGTGWGMAGYCLMPWKYILNPNLVGDLRTIIHP